MHKAVLQSEYCRKGQKMTILEGTIRENYLVREISAEETVMRRLEALGINEGTTLTLMNRKKNGAFIIKVRGTRWAIGKEIGRGISVEPVKREEAEA